MNEEREQKHEEALPSVGRARESVTGSPALDRPLHEVFDDPFSRAAGAPLIHGNRVELLRDADENYPAWLRAIREAKRRVHFESYFICEDEVGLEFADALIAKAAEGVKVRLIYDWMGNFTKASRRFWARLRQGGVEVRCYNPPRIESPLGWLSRDHRKMLAVDGEIAFITGLCVGRDWVGDPSRGLAPWRDTGVEIRGRAVPAIEHAFARVWAMTGDPIPDEDLPKGSRAAGRTAMRIVATEPATAGMLRLDQLVATLATSRLWLADAYYAGTPSYVQALRAAAKDGIDVRLLVPGSTDVPLMSHLSRAGYRPLLEAGVRVFEWNGTMLHAKTAVADGAWARVGSTNLNVASWFGNCELDAVIEDEEFAAKMEQAYLEDLENATEIVLDMKRPRIRPRLPRWRRASEAPAASADEPDAKTAKREAGTRKIGGRGSASRAAAGAIRIGNTIGAAIANRRLLGPVEARLATFGGGLLVGLALLFAVFPRILAYPVALIAAWGGLALLVRGGKLWRERRRAAKTP
ncbi:MAG: phospholipase D-like domain-containing protein [Gammaproteobacteria bacterium]|nr:cardiolipin synthase B [Gammaproteobacteria bacterium]